MARPLLRRSERARIPMTLRRWATSPCSIGVQNRTRTDTCKSGTAPLGYQIPFSRGTCLIVITRLVAQSIACHDYEIAMVTINKMSLTVWLLASLVMYAQAPAADSEAN